VTANSNRHAGRLRGGFFMPADADIQATDMVHEAASFRLSPE
jgi:hypothetical protein